MARHSNVLWLKCRNTKFHFFPFFHFFHCFLLGFSFLWTRVPQLAALALHSSPKVGLVIFFPFKESNAPFPLVVDYTSCQHQYHSNTLTKTVRSWWMSSISIKKTMTKGMIWVQRCVLSAFYCCSLIANFFGWYVFFRAFVLFFIFY